jgi:hypothetical protein
MGWLLGVSVNISTERKVLPKRNALAYFFAAVKEKKAL